MHYGQNAFKDPDRFLIETINGLRDIVDYEAKFKNEKSVIKDMAREIKDLADCLYQAVD